ncbi:MAG: amino acid ABC transporter substrate-binding protein, partial [Oscillospiraceae bacterium]
FVMGLDDSFPPMGFRDDNNEIVGLDIDIARAICDKLGLELVLQPINWDTKEMELETGNIDVIWNALTITPARQESMLISKPYLKNNQVICVKADSAIASKADLAGKKVAVQLGSSADEALMKDDISSKIGEKLEFDNNVSALLDCKTGGVDAVVLDEVVANYYAKQEPDSYKVLSDSLAAEEYGIAFKKGNQKLHDSIMNEFDALAKDGTLKGVSEKWFGKDIIVK